MILRRIIAHFRKQEWTAIFLDFVIVVLGVFVGIQVSNWNGERQAAAQRAAAIDRLHEEAEQAVTYFRAMVEEYDDVNAARSEAIARLIRNDWRDADAEKMTIGIVSTSLLPSASPQRSAYDEIINTGLYAEIGDVALRKSISDYYSQLSFLQGQIAYARQFANDYPDWGHPGIKAVFDRGTERERKYVIDFEMIGGDRDFLEGMVAGNNSIRALTRWWRDTQEMAEKMCAETARVSGKPCEPSQSIRGE